ncbi:cobalamin-binding protein [Planococcus lenghuensis]|uniref:Cobalamin-binding protein n=1 Tax=Planococcus lenghuensis TaxID=2213202 RepID=A0A1Q2L3N2_9BACL|nr:cobalamin-binding protein [Planococcus lenghuensis]AQQ55023.1 cobalamin-binding protein [Planococcus lenghuensis]
MRIISICPSNTELLAYLGALDQLIAVDDFSDWPEQVNMLPRLGPDLSIRMDDLEGLQPDLVLASLSVPGMEKNVAELEKRGIPHLVLNPQSLFDIRQDLQKTGKAIGTDPTSSLMQYDIILEEIRERGRRTASTPSLYWEWWPKPVFTPGGINWLTEISRITGASNVFGDVDEASIQTDWEAVRKLDPDYILLAWVGVLASNVKPAVVKKRPGWMEMKAISNIHIMEEFLYCRPSPRLLEGAIRLGKLIHPEQYEDMEIPHWLTNL